MRIPGFSRLISCAGISLSALCPVSLFSLSNHRIIDSASKTYDRGGVFCINYYLHLNHFNLRCDVRWSFSNISAQPDVRVPQKYLCICIFVETILGEMTVCVLTDVRVPPLEVLGVGLGDQVLGDPPL